MHAANDRGHVMFAVRLEPDVAQHDHFVIAAGFLEGTLEIIAWMILIAGKPFLISTHHARRGRSQPLAIGVVAGPANERTYGRLRLLACYPRQCWRFRRRTLIHPLISRPARPCMRRFRATTLNKASTLAPIVGLEGKGCA